MNRLVVILAVLALLPGLARAQYAVGTADITVYDPARDDRPVPADLYYPATVAGQDAPPAEPPAGGFATVAFGHGYLMGADLYAWVAADLAAGGCLVAVARTGGELFPAHAEFGLDLAFLTRALRAWGDDPGSPFCGRLNDRALVAGHSLGGGASFLAAASDPSVTAVANFAAAETDPSAIAACGQLTRPVVLFAGTNDCVTAPDDHQIPMFEALAGGWRTLVTLGGASHCQWAAYSWVCEFGESCEPGIAREAQQDLTLLLLRPWVRAVLLDDGEAAIAFQTLLDTTPGVTYQQAGGMTAAPPLDSARRLTLAAAGPNPFRSQLDLRVAAPGPQPVAVEVFDVSGRRIRVLAAAAPAPAVSLRWDGRDDAGRAAPAGVYLVRACGSDAGAWLRVTRLR